MKKAKIGQGFYPSGYGKPYRKTPIVWLINGKAYVKDSITLPYETDLDGYVMVNVIKSGDKEFFAEEGLISNHRQYVKN